MRGFRRFNRFSRAEIFSYYGSKLRFKLPTTSYTI